MDKRGASDVWWKLGGAVTAAVSIAGAICAFALFSRRDVEPLDPRWFEARLSVTREWQPCRALGSGPLAARRCATPPALTAVDLTSRERTIRSGAMTASDRVGELELLVWGGERYADLVVRRLRMAAEVGEAAAWNDLGAAYLKRAEWQGTPLDLVRALGAFERAGRLDGDDPAVAFNRAVIRERLFLHAEAHRSWERFLELDDSSPWADEARQRLATLPAAREPSASPGEAGVDNQRERFWLQEELIPAWAAAALTDPRAAAELVESGLSGAAALADRSGDELLLSAFRTIHDAQDRGDVRTLQLLASAHASVAAAAPLLDDDVEQAAALFASAKAELEQAGSVFAGWAHLGLVRARYRQMDLHGVEEEAQRLLATLEPHPVSALRARLLWVQGLARHLRGELRAAREAFAAARAEFASLGESPSEAAVLMLLAGIHDQLFEREEAWHLYLEVLARSTAVGDDGRRLMALSEAAFSALEVAGPEAALALQQEVVDIADRSEPDYLVDVLINRATLLVELGAEGAVADLDRAETLAGRITDPSIQALDLARISAGRGRHLVMTERPAEATAALEEGIGLLADRDLRIHLPELYLELGRAHRALGASREAERALASAVDEIEWLRRSVTQDLERIALADRAAEVREELVEIALAEGRFDEALAILEVHRSRQLLERLHRSAPSPAAADVRLDEVADAVLVFEVMAERTAVWALRGERREVTLIPAGREEVARWASRLHEEIASDEMAALATLERLHEMLVAPVEDAIEGATRLIVVPDEQLFQLPFAALRDARSGRFLLDDHVMVIAPSLAVAARRNRRNAPGVAPSSVLAVADPALAPDAHPALPPLPAARNEASAIAAAYPTSRMLVGAEATEEALLADLPHFEVVHVAAHAIDGGRQPLDAALVLASSSGDGGGLVTAQRLLEVRPPLQTRLVVLAACSTSGEAISSSEGPLGLAWPLLAQGVPSVVASLWPLEDRSSSDLFARFHALVADGTGVPQALRRAQLEVRDSPLPLRDWAVVVVFGSHYN